MISAIVVAGGKGERFGRAKQFLPVAGKPMVQWSLEAFLAVPEVAEVVLVINAEDRARVPDLGPRLVVAEAGATRLASVKSGVAASRGTLIAVHDGARPLVEPELIVRCLNEAERHGAAVAAAPMVDTLKEVDGEFVASTPDRARFWAAQTPQCYRREVLEKALEAFGGELQATDESQLVERLGHKVKLVESGRDNLKVTKPSDLVAVEAFLSKRAGLEARVRTGYGFDLHRLVAGRPLWLGGVQVPHTKGLLGHSDGDVLLHAVCDALLGAANLGEIGALFPSDDPSIAGVASRDIAGVVRDRLLERRVQILNIDATLVAEEPKLAPRYDEFRASLSSIFAVGADRVSVKAKSHEGLGEIGRGEAIACHAIVTVTVSA